MHDYVCMLPSLYYFDKSSQCTFSQHLPLQSMNTNTKVACERCSKLIKKTLVRPKSTAAIHFTPCLSAFMVVFEMQVVSSVVLAAFQCWHTHTFIMQPTRLLQGAAGKATSKNLKFSFLETTGCNKKWLKNLFLDFLPPLHNGNHFSSG